MRELSEHAIVGRAAAGGLRAWRPGVQRLPEDDDGPRPVGYGGYRSPHHRDAAPRRPLRPAMARVAANGIGTVGRVLGIQEFGAVAAIAFALHVAKGRVRQWGCAGVERELAGPFCETVERLEEERHEQARRTAT